LNIIFADSKLERESNSAKSLVRRHGPVQAKIIQRRLVQLQAATVLDDMRSVPGRFHPLTADRLGQFAMDLDGPHRLILEPADEPLPRLADGGLDLAKVTVVRILGVEDYHD